MDKGRAERIAIKEIKKHFQLSEPKLLSAKLKNNYFEKKKAWIVRYLKACPECGDGWYEVAIDDKTGKVIGFDESK